MMTDWLYSIYFKETGCIPYDEVEFGEIIERTHFIEWTDYFLNRLYNLTWGGTKKKRNTMV